MIVNTRALASLTSPLLPTVPLRYSNTSESSDDLLTGVKTETPALRHGHRVDMPFAPAPSENTRLSGTY